MDTFGCNDMARLVDGREGAHVSIFVSGTKPQARLRQLLNEAEHRLVAHGVGPSESARLLKAGKSLLDDSSFWRYPAPGLALFFAPGFFRSYRLGLPLPPGVVAGEHFAIRPLLSLLHPGGPFYVLALSLNQVRFLEATHHSVRRVPLPGVPAGLRQTLGDPRIGAAGDLDRGLERVAREVDAFLSNRPVPVVLAARAPFARRYREVCPDPRVLDEPLLCDPDVLGDSEISHRAWRLVEPRVLRDREAALERFAGEPAARRLATVEEILAAAAGGRIEVLFLAEPAEAFPGGEDRLDLAAQLTLAHGGTVFSLPPARMPAGTGAAAILRV